LYVNWRFMRGIEAQFLALQKGFNELIPQHLLKPFDQKELEVGTWCNSSLGCE
jgi:E3 ubiquitin ligase SMURF1/2